MGDTIAGSKPPPERATLGQPHPSHTLPAASRCAPPAPRDGARLNPTHHKDKPYA